MLVFEEDLLRLICWYAPQSRSLEDKQSSYDKLTGEWDTYCVNGVVMCLGYFNGHVSRHIDGFDSFLGWYGVGQRNV